MNKMIIAAAALATFAFTAPADAKPDHQERAAWAQTTRENSAGLVRSPRVEFDAPQVIEGRNASTSNPSIEPYILQSMDQNARSR